VKRGDRVLDLAGGTGDIAALLQPRVGEDGEVVLGDINAAMLGVGRDRLTDRGLVRGLRTCSSTPRRCPSRSQLRPGHHRLRPAQRHRQGRGAARDAPRAEGRRRALVLEFSQVQPEWFKPIYDFHSFKVLPRWASCSPRTPPATSTWPSRSASIRARKLAAMMADAGFERCSYRNLNGGIVAIHSGYSV
jgi:demethylmenaquinone methyltransferase/2-methoxy-6-polyprenyl-1,4-benzoquinol methylase